MFAFGKRSVCTSVSDLSTNESLAKKCDLSNKENNENALIENKNKKIKNRKKCKKYQDLVIEIKNDFEAYSSHENLSKLDVEKNLAKEELLNAIDKTLIRFGLNDNEKYEPDLNMNEDVKTNPVENANTNENDEIFIPTIQNIINNGCQIEKSKLELNNQSILSHNEDNHNSEIELFRENAEGKKLTFTNSESFVLSKSTNTNNNYSLKKSKSAPNPFKNSHLRMDSGKLKLKKIMF